jgi:hypothetical protein
MSKKKSVLYLPELLNVRIESDGTPYGCKIVDIDSGKSLNNVVAATWNLATGAANRGEATITLTLLPVKIVGKAMVQYTCDGCRDKMRQAEEEQERKQAQHDRRADFMNLPRGICEGGDCDHDIQETTA